MKMYRNHLLTSFGPLCCVLGETAEDIKCPIRGDSLWVSVLKRGGGWKGGGETVG